MAAQPEPWFERRIKRGLAALMALRMEGHPPADTVEATAKVWVQALWPGRAWVEALDADRIGEAFRQITLHETRWPTPAVFLRYLPARMPQKSLPPPAQTAEEKERARAILAGIMEALKSKRTINESGQN
ncbi:hypothetical protein EDC61_11946 [Sulfuritortus calidifontis]|uniref:Uncharacterized protein n=1 Tax=Sulfuritortus calidifontis TaxID=1914471 RepID=A0A4R3JRM2_9PROT|nr:hypothetical protein [Sulfuritortus calidifontis]TCS69746.1 hypothetical protein EDC61_11946 [Sulfuritortus calidifontis]